MEGAEGRPLGESVRRVDWRLSGFADGLVYEQNEIVRKTGQRVLPGKDEFACYILTMESQSFSPEQNSFHADGSKRNHASQTLWRGGKSARYNRIIIYPKDIQLITGKSERYGRMMLRKVKDHFHKANHHLVTVDEFCEYTGIGVEVVRGILG